MRLLIKRSLLLLLILAMSGCEVIQGIDKGLYQVSEEITEKDQITGQRTINLLDREHQIKTGNKAIEDIIAQMDRNHEPYNEALDERAYLRITHLFNRVHAVTHLRGEQWKPILVKDDSFNAYTTGGTYIVIHSGLENSLTDDDQLAAVIAHEIAHTVAGHAYEAGSFVTLAKAAGSNSANRDSFKTAFTHEQEKEADEIGILYLALAGFNPMAASEIWRDKLNEAGVNAGYTYSHPHNLARLRNNEQTGKKVLTYYTPDTVNTHFEEILDDNVLWQKDQAEELKAGKGGGITTLLNAYLEAENKKYKAQAEELRQQNRIRLLNSAIKSFSILESKAISANTWQLRLKYEGFTSLKEVIWKGRFQSLDNAPITIVCRYPKTVRLGSVISLEFTDPKLYAYSQKPEEIGFSLDHAENAFGY